MQPTTESRLLAQIRVDNGTAYTAFITGHLGMVYNLARRVAHGTSGELADELAVIGQSILLQEAHVFAANSLNCRFSTYVHTRIWRGMISCKRREGLLPRESEWQARKVQKQRRKAEHLAKDTGYCPRCQDHLYQDASGRCEVCGEFCWPYRPSREEYAFVYEEEREDPDFVRASIEEESRGIERESIKSWAQEEDEWQREEARQQRYGCLPKRTRELLFNCLDRAASTDGISLAAVAQEQNIPRELLVKELICVLEAK